MFAFQTKIEYTKLDYIYAYHGERGQSMGLFRKENQPKTAEEYRKSAAEHQAAAKSMFSTFLKTGFFMAAALIAIFLGSMAWFAINTNVRSSGVQISTDNGQRFYLATKKEDSQGVYDNNQENGNLWEALRHFKRITDETISGLPQFNIGTTTVRGSDDVEYIVGDADGISLMVNSKSNVNNTTQNAYVGPGSRGEMTFYIIPTVEGLNKVSITLLLSAYHLTVSENPNRTATATMIDGSDKYQMLRNMLCGHILVFQGKDNNGDYEEQITPALGANGSVIFSFDVTGDNWPVNQPIAVTLYWIWPHRFENLVYPGQPDSVFQTAAQGDFLSWINNNSGLIVIQNDVKPLEEVKIGMSNSGLSQWSAGYNRGDQLIGDTVAYFVWTINAES